MSIKSGFNKYLEKKKIEKEIYSKMHSEKKPEKKIKKKASHLSHLPEKFERFMGKRVSFKGRILKPSRRTTYVLRV